MQNGQFPVPAGKVAMVVTDLEMTSPRLRGATLPEGLTFEAITPDGPAYRRLFRHIGEAWLWYGRLAMPEAELAGILADPNVPTYTLRRNGEAEALLELDFRKEDACELAYFGVSDALIGSGAGAFLMDRAIALAFEQPIRRFHLHTCTIDSPQALGFYTRSGFAITGQKLEIDDDPRLAGILPESAAPHVPLIRP